MSDSYTDSKVRDALVSARGSRALAQKLVMQAALKDERLLQGLAAPFIKAIVGAAIERVCRREGLLPEAPPTRPRARPQPQPQPTLSKEALDAVLAQMGRGADSVPPPRQAAPAPRPAAAPLPASAAEQAARILGRAPASGGGGNPAAGSVAAQAARILGGTSGEGGQKPAAAGVRHEVAMRTIVAAFARKRGS